MYRRLTFSMSFIFNYELFIFTMFINNFIKTKFDMNISNIYQFYFMVEYYLHIAVSNATRKRFCEIKFKYGSLLQSMSRIHRFLAARLYNKVS